MKFGKLLNGIADNVDSVAERTSDMSTRIADSFARDKHYLNQILKNEGNVLSNASNIFFRGDNAKDINNLYTGYGLSATGKTVTGAGLAIYAGSQIGDLEDEVKERARKNYIQQQSDELDIESPLASRADGQGYSIDTSQLLENVQSQGDLVFALNKTRQGGYL